MATVSDPFIVRGRWVLPGGDNPEAVLQDGAVVVRLERIEEIGSWTELRARYPDAVVFGSERHALGSVAEMRHHAVRVAKPSPTIGVVGRHLGNALIKSGGLILPFACVLIHQLLGLRHQRLHF